ncbi:hypothetical protein ASD62_03330 [Phycicoccus sp. Root563]|uniref:hypothetical protein n=1 Tax=Phycicoccus sp. Root563 TaxID=1736562 RepID=UPI0007027180|nr:hypothetical protein [Phycicoccus sp. Root563]KQZ88490.1 hypothetical protein ASD62_03330 [Phycicoccus sp. Root563]
MTSTTELLDRAAGHLHAAAQQVDNLGHLHDSPSLRAFAGQIRLNAAGLSCDPEPIESRWVDCSIPEQLKAALDSLDEIHPLEGPPDLPMWAWHVADLVRIAKDTDAR